MRIPDRAKYAGFGPLFLWKPPSGGAAVADHSPHYARIFGLFLFWETRGEVIKAGKQRNYRRLAAAIILRAIRDTKSDIPWIQEDAKTFLKLAANQNSWPHQIFHLAGIDPAKTVNQVFGQQKALH